MAMMECPGCGAYIADQGESSECPKCNWDPDWRECGECSALMPNDDHIRCEHCGWMGPRLRRPGETLDNLKHNAEGCVLYGVALLVFIWLVYGGLHEWLLSLGK